MRRSGILCFYGVGLQELLRKKKINDFNSYVTS